MSRFVTRERVEQLRGSGHCKREHQPVRLGGRERCLGRGGGGVSIPQVQVRDAGEQMRFNERERGDDRGRDVQDASECIQRCGRVPLRQADHCARVVNGTHLPVVDGTDLPGLGGESGERCARLIWHPKASLRGREPSGDPRRESVHTCE